MEESMTVRQEKADQQLGDINHRIGLLRSKRGNAQRVLELANTELSHAISERDRIIGEFCAANL